MERKQLIDAAIEARKLSYSPYSNFAVGAVILTKDGKLFKGANIENAAYGLCMCAERNALYHAYMNGYKKADLSTLVVVADTPTPCAPCGSCRQVISELFPEDALIIMANVKGDFKETTIKELLPYSFSSEDLK